MVEQVQYQGDTYIISRHGKPGSCNGAHGRV